jgi:maltooligosyltrehalose trehalohydrolase
MVAVIGRREAYYTDYRGTPQELVSAAKHGFLFQGQRYSWQKKRRGTPSLDIPAEKLVCYIQDHDQVANSATGERVHQLTSPGRFRALTALLLLGPNTPMLFQGQEFGSSAPFLYFADHKPELAQAVAKGRRDFLSQFPSIAAIQDRLAPPHDPQTFERCKLDHSERDKQAAIVALHGDLLRLRRNDPSFSTKQLDGAVLGEEAFLLRFMPPDGEDRLLIVNFGADLLLNEVPEPLLAPPAECRWQLLWSSEWPQYGGSGTVAVEVDADPSWHIPAQAAVLLRPVR